MPDSDQGSPLVDCGLRCEKCGYNLTGLTESRCPECAAIFTREPEDIQGSEKQVRRIVMAVLCCCFMVSCSVMVVPGTLSTKPITSFMAPDPDAIAGIGLVCINMPVSFIGLVIAVDGCLNSRYGKAFWACIITIILHWIVVGFLMRFYPGS